MRLMPDVAMLLLPFRKTVLDGEPLRVGVVVDGDPPSPWENALVTFLRQIPRFDVHLLPVAPRCPRELKRPAWLMDRLYSASRAKFDPFGSLTLDTADSAVLESVEGIRAADSGVIIWLAACRDPDIELLSISKHGVFTVRFGDGNGTIPFWDEVATSSVTSTMTVFWHDRSFAQGRAVRKAETPTAQGLFVTENAEQPLAATMRILAVLCLDIQAGAPQFKEQVRALAPQRLDRVAPRDSPSNLDAARFIAKKLMRSANLRWMTRGKIPRWFIALRPNCGDSITDQARLDLTRFKEVPLPRAVEAMADPFLWEVGDCQYLFFEEVATGQSHGRLGCVELLPKGCYSEMTIILERPYHISYPCIVPSNGDLFLLPETSEAGRVDVYRFSRFPLEVELVSSPAEGVALVDTTPVFSDGQWYFFTTTIEPFMETLLFTAPRLHGPWSLHPCNPVSTSVRSCRSAGHLFWRNGRLFRPTQDCSIRYGYAITVNEVTRLTPHEFEERRVSYVPPLWGRELLGTHTWNESSRFQVLDGIRLVSSPDVQRPV